MAGAFKVPGLVKSLGLVVEPVSAGERRKYRSLVLAVPLSSGAADWQPRQQLGPRAYAIFLRGLCLRLRIQVVPSACGCSADLLVRHVAFERNGRPLGSNRGRGLLRGAVGHYSAPTGYDDGSGHHP